MIHGECGTRTEGGSSDEDLRKGQQTKATGVTKSNSLREGQGTLLPLPPGEGRGEGFRRRAKDPGLITLTIMVTTTKRAVGLFPVTLDTFPIPLHTSCP